jgi:hypothetical protein
VSPLIWRVKGGNPTDLSVSDHWAHSELGMKHLLSLIASLGGLTMNPDLTPGVTPFEVGEMGEEVDG